MSSRRAFIKGMPFLVMAHDLQGQTVVSRLARNVANLEMYQDRTLRSDRCPLYLASSSISRT